MTNLNQLPTQLKSASSARAASGETGVLAQLGEQLILDPLFLKQNPELAQLLEQSPEGTSFDQLLAQLKNSQGELDPKLLAQMTKNQLDGKTGQIAETNPEQLNKLTQNIGQEQILKQEASGPKIPFAQNKASQSELAKLVNQNKNAEDASRAFMPKRKSIFKVNPKQAPEVAANKANKNQQINNKLMDLNTFMSKQTNGTKANMVKSAYQNQASESMFAKKIEAAAPKLTNSLEQPSMKVTDLMLMNPEQGADSSMDMSQQGSQFSQMNQQSTPMPQIQTTKVFDMGQMNMNQDVINQIQDYIIQAKTSSEPTVQMSFAHNDLGMIDLIVQKAHGDNVSVMINTHSMEGAKFFNQNQTELLQTLKQSGVQVSEFKLDSSSNSQNNQDSLNQNNSRQSNQQHASQDKQQRDQDSQRREELWNLLNENRTAA